MFHADADDAAVEFAARIPAARQLDEVCRGAVARDLPIRAVADLVEAAVRAGQPDRGQSPAADLERWAEHAATPTAQALTLRCRALLDDDGAEGLLAEAVERCASPYDRARTQRCLLTQPVQEEPPMLLDSKTAVIYGGGGSIGGAIAKGFAAEVARCVLVGRTRPRSTPSPTRSGSTVARSRPQSSTPSTRRP